MSAVSLRDVSSKQLLGWCGILYLGYLWWVRPRIGLPLLADEVAFAAATQLAPAQALQIIPHPPVYLGLLKLAAHLGGLHAWCLRMVGVARFGLTLVGTAYAANALVPGAGGLAAVLWAMHPLAIQGSLVLDIDNTLLTAAMTFYLALLLTYPARVSARQLGWLGFAFAACLWVKLSCAPFLIFATFLRAWSARLPRLAVRQTVGISVVAGAAFLITWMLLCGLTQIPILSIFQFLAASTYTGFQWTSLGMELLNRVIRVGLWMNLWLVLLISGLGIGLTRVAPRPDGRWWCVLGLTASIFLGYVVVRGPTVGFAKYQLPALPAALILVAASVRRVVDMRALRSAVVLGAVSVIYFWVVGDVLYQVNFLLRVARITGEPSVKNAVAQLLWSSWWYMLPGVCVGWWAARASAGRVPRMLMGSLLLLIGSNLALDVRQRQAAYATTYTYGRPWASFQEAVHFVSAYRQAHPQQEIVGPLDVLWEAGVPYTARMYNRSLHDVDLLRQAAENPAVGCILYGTTTNDIRTWQTVLQDPAFLQRLQQRFVKVTLGRGEYSGWMRQ